MPTIVPEQIWGITEKTLTWLLSDSQSSAQFIESFASAFSLQEEPEVRTVSAWFDTFDWRLFSSGLLFFHDQYGWHLVPRDPEGNAAILTEPGRQSWRFCYEFPSGRIRSLLEPRVGERMLLPLFRCKTTSNGLRVLNRDGKSVAMVFLKTHRFAANGEILRTLHLQPIRGYEADVERVIDFVHRLGINVQTGPYPFYEQGVKSGGRTPLDYSSRFRPVLQPDMTSRQAMMRIYRELLACMQRNEQGLLEDLDVEFLHDFRVALRRTRSGLSQVRKVLPAKATKTFRNGFAWLGQITGPVRDLDVYLQAENGYRVRLPEVLRPGLALFFADLRRRRDRELKLLARRFKSKKYQALVADWQAFLSCGDDEETENSDQPVSEMARRIIGRRYRRLLKAAKLIAPSSPDADYHRLRIQGKKLRYVLEFFSSLFPQKEIGAAIKDLKLLQDNLGAFNDLAVQQHMLRQYLLQIEPGFRRNLLLSAAIGGLLTSLAEEQERVRNEFAGKFAAFSRPEIHALFQGWRQPVGS